MFNLTSNKNSAKFYVLPRCCDINSQTSYRFLSGNPFEAWNAHHKRLCLQNKEMQTNTGRRTIDYTDTNTYTIANTVPLCKQQCKSLTESQLQADSYLYFWIASDGVTSPSVALDSRGWTFRRLNIQRLNICYQPPAPCECRSSSNVFWWYNRLW